MEERELQNFIDAIIQKSEGDISSDRPLTRKEMEELAYSMGLTEKQFRELMVKSLRHVQTSERFLDQNNYEDGLVEAQNAVAINPYVEKGYSVLALAYFQRYNDLGVEQDRLEAEYAAQKAVKLNNHDQRAINIISALSKRQRAKSKDHKRLIVVAAALVMAMGIGIGGFIAVGKQVDGQSDQTKSATKELVIEAEETVNSIEMEIKVEQDRKNNLMREFLAVAPSNTNKQKQLKEMLTKELSGSNQAQIDKKFGEYKNTFPTKLSDGIQTHLIQIEGAENRIAFQRGELAKAIKQYNVLVKKHGADHPEFELKEYSYD